MVYKLFLFLTNTYTTMFTEEEDTWATWPVEELDSDLSDDDDTCEDYMHPDQLPLDD